MPKTSKEEEKRAGKIDRVVEQSREFARARSKPELRAVFEGPMKEVAAAVSRATPDDLYVRRRGTRGDSDSVSAPQGRNALVPAEPSERIGLAEAIQVVREELSRAALERPTDDALRLESVEIEIFGEYEQAAGTSAGVRFYVVSLGLRDEESVTKGHRIRVKFCPDATNPTRYGSE